MSDPVKPPSSLGGAPVAPMVIMKGGTTSSAYDRQLAIEKAAGEQGRAHQAKQQRAAAFGAGHTKDGFVHASLTSLPMFDTTSPRVVLYYLNVDKTVRQECVSELAVLGDGDTIFTLVCPKCLERGVSAGQAQMMVRKSHRKWELDMRRQGEVIRLRDPDGKPFGVKICGTINMDETVRCANAHCTWAVRIADSKVEVA